MSWLTADIIYTVGWLAVGLAVAWSLRLRRRASWQMNEFQPAPLTLRPSYTQEPDASTAGGSLAEPLDSPHAQRILLDAHLSEDSPEQCRSAIGRLNESLRAADGPRLKEEAEQKPLARGVADA